ncbi:MAG TPA: hypothetical protein VN763_09150, partial [Saprospiraceae bacterium]|nr:hypothetical protein [Saprospiraceae bacterium]
MSFAGDFTNNGTLTNGAGTQNYTFTGSGKTISGSGAISFETFNVNSGAFVTANSAFTQASGFVGTITGTLALSATLTNNGTISVPGTFQINQGGSLVGTAASYSGTSTLIYAGTSSQTANVNEFPASNGPANLTINNAAGVNLPAAFARTITGNLAFTTGTFADGGNTFTVGGNVSGTVSHTSTGSGKIKMTGAANSISAGSFGNLDIAGTISLTGAVSVTGNLTLTSGSLDDGGNTLTLAGDLIPVGGSHIGTGKILMTGTGKIILGSGSVGNVEIANAASISNSTGFTISSGFTLTVNGIFSMTSASITNNGTVQVNGTFRVVNTPGIAVNAAIYGPGATLILDGTIPASISSSSWPISNGPTNVTIANTGGITLGSSRTISGLLNLTTGNLNLGPFGNMTAGTVSGSASGHVITNGNGRLRVIAPASMATTFPIGTSATSYDPVTLNPSVSSLFEVKVKPANSSAEFTSPVNNFSLVVHREWDINPTGAPGNTILQLTNGDTPFSPTTPVIGHYTMGVWQEIPATYSPETWTATVSSFSPFGAGDEEGFVENCDPPVFISIAPA